MLSRFPTAEDTTRGRRAIARTRCHRHRSRGRVDLGRSRGGIWRGPRLSCRTVTAVLCGDRTLRVPRGRKRLEMIASIVVDVDVIMPRGRPCWGRCIGGFLPIDYSIPTCK